MTIGIYCLYFETDDGMFYVGQSVSIYNRYKAHCNALKNRKHGNILLQNLYNKYETQPSIAVVELANIENLDSLEKYWIEQFDSFYNGMNLTKGGAGEVLGEANPAALYDNAIYLDIVKQCANPDNTLVGVALALGISLNVVRNISCGRSCSFIGELIPELYQQMLDNNGSRVAHHTSEMYQQVLLAIANSDLPLEDIAENLNVSLRTVQDIAWGRRHLHLAKDLPEVYARVQEKIGTREAGRKKVSAVFRDPCGNKVSCTSLSELCALYDLSTSKISLVNSGKRLSHKGWKLWTP